MNIKLTKAQRDYIAAKLKTGQYDSPSEIVREAMRTNLPRFSTARMLKEYVRRLYAPAAAR